MMTSSPYHTIYESDVPMDKIPKWFVGAQLNFTENIFRKRGNYHNRTAIIKCSESWKGISATTNFYVKPYFVLESTEM